MGRRLLAWVLANISEADGRFLQVLQGGLTYLLQYKLNSSSLSVNL